MDGEVLQHKCSNSRLPLRKKPSLSRPNRSLSSSTKSPPRIRNSISNSMQDGRSQDNSTRGSLPDLDEQQHNYLVTTIRTRFPTSSRRCQMGRKCLFRQAPKPINSSRNNHRNFLRESLRMSYRDPCSALVRMLDPYLARKERAVRLMISVVGRHRYLVVVVRGRML